MKNAILSALFTVVLSIITLTYSITPADASNTPPLTDVTGNLKPALGPDGVTMMPANPAVQADGVLVPDVFGLTPNWNLTPPLRKFVDSLAPLGCNTPSNLGQCIPVAVPDTLTFPGSDYYELELQQFAEKVHTDIPNATTFRGYKQVNNGTNAAGTLNDVAPAAIHYLGPLIITQKGRAVRIKFVNKLPTEVVESFFLPVDRTVMGAGMGSKYNNGTDCDPVWDPRGRNGLPTTEPTCANYATNRAELHLHGGLNPWISDGTPHQWITPAGEDTPYKKADNVQYVPDMWFDASGNVISACSGSLTCAEAGANINPGAGAQTYYYTNDQSARLMFYHDHSYGITRLNVYAGEAAGYMIQDDTEIDLITRGVIPSDQIPLIIQDKAFVDPDTIGTLDPTWVWGTGPRLPLKWIDSDGNVIDSCTGQNNCATPNARKVAGVTPKAGDLWWPHVYMPAENPSALGGVNPMGRWVYGLYFWPPTTGIKFLPVNNPYYDCSDPINPNGLCYAPWEPPTMPATPNPSWTAEAFLDTPMVNGTVYPKLSVDPKPYRLRILNASHDRFFNLQLYEADASVNANTVNPACAGFAGGCATKTEVKMVPAIKYQAFPLWDAAADQRTGGVPDPATAGPPWIQIGSEGGFLPTPAVIPSQPISFVLDPTMFNVGNVNDGSLIMGPAERADVIVDFSQYAGKTLILYNDAPAAFPAFVPNNDYFTDAPDTTGTGGHPGPKAGIGPNTRTIMQINVAATAPSPQFDLNKLLNEFTTTPTQDGVFKKSQHPTIVGQTAYDSAYNLVFPSVAPFWGIANIGDQNISFASLNPTTQLPEIVNQYPMQPKALHDEMGAVWDEYGRMSAKLGVEMPNTNNINQIFVMQNFVDPPTENVQDGKVQLWKITHNGVDTHPLHFHLFDVQVVNRVGWDGFVRLPWANEIGWKDTVRVSPLEDTIVAMRPKAPPVPFPLADSLRLKNPTYPNNPAVTDGFMNLDPLTGQAKIPADNNAGLFNYGAEYVWHCHILSHEEQDMMRPIVFRVATDKPLDPTALTATAGFQKNTLAWTDNSYSITTTPYNSTLGFYIERCDGACDAGTGTFSRIADMSMISSANPTYIDNNVVSGAPYTYRVIGYNRYTTNGAANGSWLDGLTAPAYSAKVDSSTWSPASAVSLAPDFTSPHSGPIKFIALASGTTVQPQYRFWLNGTVVQDYSITRFWTLPAIPPTGVATTYTVKVDARTNYASATPDISNTAIFELLPTLDNTPPITTAIPAAGAFLAPVQVYLQADEAGSVTKYTLDGSDPITSATAATYTNPISINATTNLKYYSTDLVGNKEVVQSGIYELRPIALNPVISINDSASVTNSLNVALKIAAIGATKIRVYNDPTLGNSTVDEAFTSPVTKSWTLSAGVDGIRTVYIRFTDTNGVLQDPVTTQIFYDTTPPVTTSFPNPGTYLGTTNVSLTANDTSATIKYTVDGSDPLTSATAQTYSTPVVISASTVLRFSATDMAGNMEAAVTANYDIHVEDIVVNTFTINGGATITKSETVTLNISATDPFGVSSMRFSNDGVTYTADELYATQKDWSLLAGDGVKVVYVRFTDGNGFLYPPVTAQINLDKTPPSTSVFPQPVGIYVNPINVTLEPNETANITKYTIDGSDPSNPASSPLTYTGAITLSTTTVLKYFSTDTAGNVEAVKTVTYTFNPAAIAASVLINGGAIITNSKNVTLDVSANGATFMEFSNDGFNYTTSVPYLAGAVPWSLDAEEGLKSVFAKFTNSTGNLLNVVTAKITLDTTAPVTTASLSPGTFIAPVTVSLASNESQTVIKYTVDGTDPTTSATANIYTASILISADATLKYFATDAAGNKEIVKSGFYEIHTGDLVVTTFKINNGDAITLSDHVTLNINATDAKGVVKMRFSNDGVNYSQDQAYSTTSDWTLSSGNGLKNVYVRFTDGAGILYPPVVTEITLAFKDGILTGTSSQLASAIKTLQIARGHIVATPNDLAHADVAPFVNGKPQPDGKIDLADVYVLLLNLVGLIGL